MLFLCVRAANGGGTFVFSRGGFWGDLRLHRIRLPELNQPYSLSRGEVDNLPRVLKAATVTAVSG